VSPETSFIIPCYKLAHLLPECIESILSQTTKDFEILVLDDCSPDDTQRVAESFHDPRIRYVRNPVNIGHLKNYNKGIGLSAGRYVWLISADDRLRHKDALQLYRTILEQNRLVGYVFSPAVALENGTEKGFVQWTVNGHQDFVMDGRSFVRRLIHGNTIAAPSVIVRKECYEKLTLFPLDLPYGGDWYLWLAFALHYQVAYVHKPLVNYRLHPESMTSHTVRQAQIADNFAIRWRIQAQAAEIGDRACIRECRRSIVDHYAHCLASDLFQSSDYRITFQDFETSVTRYAESPAEQSAIRSMVYERLGDQCFRKKQRAIADRHYRLASSGQSWRPKLWAKRAMLWLSAKADPSRPATGFIEKSIR